MKKLTSLLITITMLFSITAFAADTPSKDYPQKFWDVPKDHWAFSYIAELVDRGIIEGYDDGSFKPDGTVTRAEFAKIMVGAAGVPTNDNNVYFGDMAGHWAIPYVNAAKNYLTAYTDNTYRPNQAAVREDITMALVRLKGYDISNVDYSYLADFTDTNSISNNVKAYVAVAIEKGLINGYEDNTFRGQSTISRAEAATLLWRAFQYGNDNKVVDTPSQTTNTQPITQNTTVTPTQIPTVVNTTAEPQITAEPTPEPTATPKPYKIDTLIKADVDKTSTWANDETFYCTTSDNNGTVYYLADNKICSLTADGNTEELLDIEGLSEINDFDEDKFEVSVLVCDTDGNLYVRGNYSSKRPSVYAVKNSKIDLVASGDGEDNIAKPLLILNDHDYIIAEWLDGHGRDAAYLTAFGSNSCEYIAGTNVICATEHDNNIIVADPTAIYEYDYNTTTKIADSYGTVGLSNNSYVIAKNNEFIIRSFDGKNEIKINADDYVINDKKSFNTSKIADRLFLTNNNEIIFYDTSAKAFRMISENK